MVKLKKEIVLGTGLIQFISSKDNIIKGVFLF